MAEVRQWTGFGDAVGKPYQYEAIRQDRRRFLTGVAAVAGGAIVSGLASPAAANTGGGDVAASSIPDLIGQLQVHKIRNEENLVTLAVDYNVGYTELMTANPGIDPWLPGEGTAVVLPTAHVLPDAPREGVVINLAEQRLYLFPTDNGPIRTFPIGIGREGLLTPKGRTEVVRKKEGPTWRPTRRMRAEDPELPAMVPPGPDNPLGTHAVYLGWPQYLIHGTNRPYGIGRRVSSGCIRMYPDDIVSLFERVPVGMPVSVVDQPMKVGRSGGEMFLEIHTSQNQADQIEVTGRFEPEAIDNFVLRVVEAAGLDVGRLDWPTATRAAHLRTGVPVQVTWSDFVEPSLDADQLKSRPTGGPIRRRGQNASVSTSDRPSSAPTSLLPPGRDRDGQ